jgi:hypothetical protein
MIRPIAREAAMAPAVNNANNIPTWMRSDRKHQNINSPVAI